jgi:hypothetical protein
MNRKGESQILGILILISIIAAVSIFIVLSNQPKVVDGLVLTIDGQQAVEIVARDPDAQQYLSENFKKPEWRLVRSTLVQNSLYDINGSIITEDQPYWKVEMMERTCSCGSAKDLFVIEGNVSPETGELMNLTIGRVMESQYEKQTCASLKCH